MDSNHNENKKSRLFGPGGINCSCCRMGSKKDSRKLFNKWKKNQAKKQILKELNGYGELNDDKIS